MGNLFPYLKSRVLQDEQIKDITKAKLPEEFSGVIDMQCVFNDNEFLERVQDPEAKFESNIECNYIDMPNIWHFKDEKFQDFFNQLAEHEDYSLFDQTVI